MHKLMSMRSFINIRYLEEYLSVAVILINTVSSRRFLSPKVIFQTLNTLFYIVYRRTCTDTRRTCLRTLLAFVIRVIKSEDEVGLRNMHLRDEKCMHNSERKARNEQATYKG
jgi:hypothetical protein